MDYDEYTPIVDKFLNADGSITTFAGKLILPADSERAKEYEARTPQVAKWLQPDGNVVDKLPLDGFVINTQEPEGELGDPYAWHEAIYAQTGNKEWILVLWDDFLAPKKFTRNYDAGATGFMSTTTIIHYGYFDRATKKFSNKVQETSPNRYVLTVGGQDYSPYNAALLVYAYVGNVKNAATLFSPYNMDTTVVGIASNFNKVITSKNLRLETINGMFRKNKGADMKKLDLGEFNTSAVTNMNELFSGCSNLSKSQILSSGFIPQGTQTDMWLGTKP